MPTKFNPSKPPPRIQLRTPTRPCAPRTPTGSAISSSLKDMTKKALDLLNDNPNGQKNGFFLQVEGASIDKQDHAATPAARLARPTTSTRPLPTPCRTWTSRTRS